MKDNLKHRMAGIAGAIAICFAGNASAAFIIGTIDPGAPADEAQELTWVQKLISMPISSTETETYGPANNLKTRTFQTTADDATASATTVGTKYQSPEIGTPNPPSISGALYTFLLGKYGDLSVVWQLESTESFSAPVTVAGVQQQLSHQTPFSGSRPPSDTPRTPDGGTTLAALGLSLLGLGSMRRFLIKKG